MVLSRTKMGDCCFTTAAADASGRSTDETSTGNNFPRDCPHVIINTGATVLANSDFQYCTGNFGGHLEPVTLKPVSCIFRILMPAFPHFPHCRFVRIFRIVASWNLPRPLFSGVRGTFRIFRTFPISGFESLILKIRLTGFIVTGLGDWEIFQAPTEGKRTAKLF